MAKQMMPTPTGGGLVSKLIGIAIVVALFMVVVNHPGDSAGWLKDLGGMFMDAVDGLATFFHNLSS